MELAELIESIDIVEYISQFVDLEQKGKEWWGLSCFKDEKTPSFSVRKDPPVFYDYSSGIGGNVFTFVKFYNRCSSAQAVEILRNYVGLSKNALSRSNKMLTTTVCRRFKAPPKTKKDALSSLLPDNLMEKYEDKPEKP